MKTKFKSWRKASWIAAVIIGMGLASVWQGGDPPAASAPPSPQSESDANALPLGALSEQLRQVREELAALRRASTARNAETAALPVATDKPAKDAPVKPSLSEEELRTRDETVTQRAQDLYADQLESEGPDPDWSRNKELAIEDFLRSDAFADIGVEVVTCRRTLCRVSVSYENDEARNHFIDQLGSKPFAGGAFFSNDEEASVTTAYIARVGHALPMPSLDFDP